MPMDTMELVTEAKHIWMHLGMPSTRVVCVILDIWELIGLLRRLLEFVSHSHSEIQWLGGPKK